jgi:hypothetical protein
VPPYRNKRFLAILAAALTFGAFVTVAQVSNAAERRKYRPPVSQPCPPTSNTKGGTAQQPASTEGAEVTQQNGREVRNYRDDGNTAPRRWPGNRPKCTPTNNTGATPTNSSGTSEPPALEILGNDCENSRLEAHDGFQKGERCVSVAHGEVPAADKSPSLLITGVIVNGRKLKPGAQQIVVPKGTKFELEVSTRNLVRDRFLGAGAGGYYLESSFLNGAGLVRGHFHNSCRALSNNNEAPDASPVPAFFVATEDGGGGAAPDRIRVAVTLNPADFTGDLQCSSWAGDGSHRIPMEERANMQPAFDSLRLTVR